MKVIRLDGTKIHLTQKNFVSAGGEGSIYAIDNKAFKVYRERKKIIRQNKINELKLINSTSVIKPEGLIHNHDTYTSVGYQMDFIKNTTQICAIFPRAYRDQYKITPENILKLICNIRNIIETIHAANVLLVDFNELNVLISKSDYSKPYFIDVDSYQTKTYKATAIMESIRDRHSNLKFSEGTDWFAFAIMAVQLLMGIHPYKGKHPKVKTLDERMKSNVSIFNKDVSIPHTCYSVKQIPRGLYTWLQDVLESGERTTPPTITWDSVALTISTVAVPVNADIILVELKSFDASVLKLDKDFVFNGQEYKQIKDKLFIVKKDKLTGITHSKHVANVMPMSTKSYHNILIQVCLKTAMGMVFDGERNFSFSFDKLLGKRIVPNKIINAFFAASNAIPIQRGMGAIVFEEGGGYKKAVFRIDITQGNIELIDVFDVDDVFLSIVVKPNGVAVFTGEEGNVIITSSIISDNRRKIIKSDVLDGERLSIVEGKVVVIRGNKVFEVKI